MNPIALLLRAAGGRLRIEAYGITDIIDVDARDGLVIVRALMRGGEQVRFALRPELSERLRQYLQPTELAAVAQRKAQKEAGDGD